jgi:hypothetical protein
MKILFILKINQTSGAQSTNTSKSGLTNASRFVVDTINGFPGIEAFISHVKDQNGIYKQLIEHKPNTVIIEAVFVTPGKLAELIDKFPHIRFITRIHSRIPFIAMEGNVIQWIKEYQAISEVSFNNHQTANDMQRIGIENVYLPNIYPHVEHVNCTEIGRKHHYKIGCFGSIRPFKNQLSQAWAAIMFAEKRKAIVHFYVNAAGIEQKGESVLKNIRALFAGTRHKLIEIDWLEHHEFINLIKEMDACMQVSFTETFNLVTADAILAHVPVVVSDQIDWLTCRKANPNDESDIADVLEHVIDNNVKQVEDNIQDLESYNHHAILKWFRFLNRH